MPKLKVIFYASGSVQHFAEPLLERGIVICSAAEANAIPVAEFCLGQILLSTKRVWSINERCRKGPWKKAEMPIGRGNYGATISLLGIGSISRHLLKLLKPFELSVIAVEEYLENSPERAQAMGIEKLVSIEEAFLRGYVVSNHFADKPTNQAIIQEKHFMSMPDGATFINTGRGAQVDEAGMIRALKKRLDLTALLDVQHPEPPDPTSELYELPNVYMTCHVAGSINNEVKRMADYMIDDFERWLNHAPLKYRVSPDTFGHRA